jgi:hypothetical protein
MNTLTEFKRLPKTIENMGVSIKDLTTTCIVRNGHKAIYKRSDGYYEVILIRVRPERMVFGKFYPAEEVYPTTAEFGRYGWFYPNYTLAKKQYEET